MTTFARLLLPLWLALLGAGFYNVWRYEATAGASAPPSRRVSGETGLDPGRPTVVMFAHPDCPCTRAGLEGLAELARRAPGRARIVVEIVGRGGGANADVARRIPGARVVQDAGGVQARRWGAATSGQVLAFAADGTPQFRGGLTSARGHVGPSAGLDALDAIFAGEAPRVHGAPVYGCPLQNQEAR